MFESEIEVGRRQGSDACFQEPAGTFPLHIDGELTLKGKVCPYTFVESMLALEEMQIDRDNMPQH